jgi:hypothetical protein
VSGVNAFLPFALYFSVLFSLLNICKFVYFFLYLQHKLLKSSKYEEEKTYNKGDCKVKIISNIIILKFGVYE